MMSKQFTPRTAVKPDGGVYRVQPTPQPDVAEWLKNNQHMVRFLNIGDLREMMPVTWEDVGKLIAAVPRGEVLGRIGEMVAEDLGVQDGQQHWRVKEDFRFPLTNTAETLVEMKELSNRFGDLKIRLASPSLLSFPLDTEKDIAARAGRHMAQAEESWTRTQATLQFMWDAMPLELKQQIVEQYHPHNCVKKDD